MAASRTIANDNQIAQEFGGSERRLPMILKRSVIAVYIESSILVTMIQHDDSKAPA